MSVVSIFRYTRRDTFDKPLITGGIDVLRIPVLVGAYLHDPVGLMEKVNRWAIPTIRKVPIDNQDEIIRRMIALFPRIMFHVSDEETYPFRVRTASETLLEYKIAEERDAVDPLLPTDYIASTRALKQYCFFTGAGRSSDITRMMKEDKLNSFLREDIQGAHGRNDLQQMHTFFRIYLLSEVNHLKAV